MLSNIVLTLTGADRIGIVEEVTRTVFELGGNVETSRMSRLGGEFAIIMLVSLPADRVDDLDQGFGKLISRGYKMTTTRTEQTYAEAHPGWKAFQIEVRGADHEGIIHQVAHYLSQSGISIESMDAETTRAPISGSLLFAMTALVVVPPDLQGRDWEAALKDVGRPLNVDIQVTAVKEK
jgi:glycine cleavage system transcriptional repressor